MMDNMRKNYTTDINARYDAKRPLLGDEQPFMRKTRGFSFLKLCLLAMAVCIIGYCTIESKKQKQKQGDQDLFLSDPHGVVLYGDVVKDGIGILPDLISGSVEFLKDPREENAQGALNAAAGTIYAVSLASGNPFGVAVG